MKKLYSVSRRTFVSAAAALAGNLAVGSRPGFADTALPDKFADDPVAKALGPDIFNAALKEGKVVWYGATTTHDFVEGGGRDSFEKRFGIKLELINGRLRNLTDRILTEVAVGKVQGDAFLGNDEYMLELQKNDALQKWRPPAPELARINQEAFVRNPEGYWWPVQISTQGLLVNTSMQSVDEIKSYRDLLNPKFQGKVVIRDPRALDGGGGQMLSIYYNPTLGIDYIEQFIKITKPVIIQGGTEATLEAVARGQFAIGFSGRGEFMLNLPKDTPVAFVVPKEGLTWLPSSVATLNASANPNAAKVLLTWFYELPQLQLWGRTARGVPHPDVKPPIPQMSVTDYPLMPRIPDEVLSNLDPFFDKMEQEFGVR